MTREIVFEPGLPNQRAITYTALRPCETAPPPEHFKPSKMTNRHAHSTVDKVFENYSCPKAYAQPHAHPQHDMVCAQSDCKTSQPPPIPMPHQHTLNTSSELLKLPLSSDGAQCNLTRCAEQTLGGGNML